MAKKVGIFQLLFGCLFLISIYCFSINNFRADFLFRSNKMDDSDDRLERSLKELFCDDFGYTLFGVKPVSFTQGFGSKTSKNYDDKLTCIRYLEQFFAKRTDFILRVKITSDHIDLLLINTKCLIETLKKNKKFLNIHYPQFASAEKILQNIDQLIDVIFHHSSKDTELVGLCLGFGRSNAVFFGRRIELADHLNQYPFVSLLPLVQFCDMPASPLRRLFFPKRGSIPFTYKAPKKNEKFRSFQDEWCWIKKNTTDTKGFIPHPPYYISLPGFVSQNTLETKKILQKYATTRELIGKLFVDGKFGSNLERIQACQKKNSIE